MSCALRCGTAGWSYPHWNTTVYPRPKPRGFHPLEYLARYFDALEINSTFHRPAKPEITRLWATRVAGNREFRFTAKLGRRFTHERELRLAEVTEFREGIRPLLKMGRLGCLLMQFPWSFRFTPENRRYLIELRRAFGEFPLVAEMRHASWAREEAVGTFIDYKVGFCNIDQPVFEKAMPPTAFLTSSIGYIRLHGRSALPQGREYRDGNIARNDYLYPESELADWVDRAQRIGRYADAVYVITTNDAAGKAVVNALQVQSLLGVRETKYPADLVRRHWPKLARGESSSLQHSLFGEGMVVPERAVA